MLSDHGVDGLELRRGANTRVVGLGIVTTRLGTAVTRIIGGRSGVLAGHASWQGCIELERTSVESKRVLEAWSLLSANNIIRNRAIEVAGNLIIVGLGSPRSACTLSTERH